VDDLVSVHDFLDEGASLHDVHALNLLEALVVSLLEFFKTLLELDKLVREQFVILGVSSVRVLSLDQLILERLFLLTEIRRILLQFVPQTLLLFLEDRLTLIEHLMVEEELRLIQLVDGLHVLHALFEDLHFGLELDLLLSLLVRVLSHRALQVSRVIALLLLPLVEEVLLDVTMLLEKVLNFDLVALEDVTALAIKLRLNVLLLGGVALTHGNELVLHLRDERINVLRHLRNRFDVMAVLLVNLSLEFLDKLLLIGDDLSTGSFLRLNILLNKTAHI